MGANCTVLFWRRRTLESESIHAANAALGVGGFTRHARSECECQLIRNFAIEKREGLRGNCGRVAALTRQIERRPVEHFDHRIDETALLKSVNRAAVTIAARWRWVVSRHQRAHSMSRLLGGVAIDPREDSGSS